MCGSSQDLSRAYVERVLAPELRKGNFVVMDNLSAHKVVAGVREAIKAAGAGVLYLPPYSPDLNPIEQLFANSTPASLTGCAYRNHKPAPLKKLLRKAGVTTKGELWTTLGMLLAAFRLSECRNYLTNSGINASNRERRSRTCLTQQLAVSEIP